MHVSIPPCDNRRVDICLSYSEDVRIDYGWDDHTSTQSSDFSLVSKKGKWDQDIISLRFKKTT